MTNTEINEAVARKLCPDMSPSEWPGGEPKPYATSIAAAWVILDSMRYVRLERKRDVWTCRWVDSEAYEINAEADTAPMAICQAFLKLKET